MFLAAGENLKAIEIIGQHGWVEKWVSILEFAVFVKSVI